MLDALRISLAEAIYPRPRNRLDVTIVRACSRCGAAGFCEHGGESALRVVEEKVADPIGGGFGRILRLEGLRVVRLAPSYNSRVDAGANWQAQLMGSAVGTPAAYMALSTTSLTPAKTDTTLSGEIVSGTNAGLARAAASYGSYTAPSSLNGSASYQLAKLFTSSGIATVQSAALFTASSAGTMYAEANLANSSTLAANDQLNVTWTVTI